MRPTRAGKDESMTPEQKNAEELKELKEFADLHKKGYGTLSVLCRDWLRYRYSTATNPTTIASRGGWRKQWTFA